jgi:hypothetical protein
MKITMTQALAGLGLLVLGAAIALIVRPGGHVTPFQVTAYPRVKAFEQVTGDPPVTVSDGSLHAHSQGDWQADTDGGQTIKPNPPMGTLSQTCTARGVTATTSLWMDDETTHKIAPGAKVTIVFASDEASSAAHAADIDITVPDGKGDLKIYTHEGNFGARKGKKYNREHSRSGEVESITIYNPGETPFVWNPTNIYHPHFTLLFCYQ